MVSRDFGEFLIRSKRGRGRGLHFVCGCRLAAGKSCTQCGLSTRTGGQQFVCGFLRGATVACNSFAVFRCRRLWPAIRLRLSVGRIIGEGGSDRSCGARLSSALSTINRFSH